MKRIAFALATTVIAAPAFAGGPAVVAAEPTVVAPAPVVAQVAGNWAGYYAGGNIGYGDVDLKQSGDTLGSANGVIAGVQGGYRWDMGNNLILGVEAALSGADIDNNSTGAKIKQKFDLKGQVGYDLGTSLVYATAGASWARAEVAGASGTENGWVAGVGYEYDLGNKWTVGAEALYNKFENVAGTTADIEGSTFALRANYKF